MGRGWGVGFDAAADGFIQRGDRDIQHDLGAVQGVQEGDVILAALGLDIDGILDIGEGAEDNGGICGVGMCEGIAAVRDAHGKAPVEEEIDNAGRARTAKAEVDELAGICAAVGFAMLREAVGALVRASVA